LSETLTGVWLEDPEDGDFAGQSMDPPSDDLHDPPVGVDLYRCLGAGHFDGCPHCSDELDGGLNSFPPPFFVQDLAFVCLDGAMVPLLFIFHLLPPPLLASISPPTLLMLGFLEIWIPGLLLFLFSSELLVMVGFLLPNLLCNALSLSGLIASSSCLDIAFCVWVFLFYISSALSLGYSGVGMLFR
jgi:hypothetical protein